MADTMTVKKRSEVMRKVRPSGNKSTELKLISIFQSYGIHGWHRHYQVKGHPDFVFMDKHIAVFVDGCFWHGHDCRNTRPASNTEYWSAKREKNIKHDQEITKYFQKRGWTVLRIWECELTKNKDILEAKLKSAGLL